MSANYLSRQKLAVIAAVVAVAALAFAPAGAALADTNWTLVGPHLFNTNTGNVGIGTQTPSQKLEVDGGFVVQMPVSGGGGGGNSLNGFSYARAITINAAKVPANQTNFTVLVCANGSTPCDTSVPGLNQTGSGAHVANASGNDIVFTSDATCATKLNWEMEKYAPATGEVVAWVLLPSLTTSGNTFYMCYGNSALSGFQGGAAGAAWDAGYKSVWHLPNGSTLSGADSTANGINPVSNTMTAAAGQIDGGAAATSGQYINYGGSGVAGLKITNNLTMEWWMKTGSGAQQTTVNNQFRQSNNDGINIYSDPSDMVINVGSGTGNVAKTFGGLVVNNNAWHHVVAEFASGTITVYFDGVALPTQSAGFSAIGYGNEPMYLGQNAAGNRPYAGSLDEVRISNVIRDANWIATEYSNLVLPATFETFGSEQAGGSGGGTTTYVPLFFVGQAGNVGINTTTPSQALDVAGNIKLSGSVVSDGDICIGTCQ